MKLLDLLKLSTRMFKARTTRTLLTILGMGVGIGAILFLVGLGYGIQKTLLETITTADSLLTLDIYPGEDRKAIDSADISKISTIEGVEDISPVMETMGQMKYADLLSDLKVLAIDEKFIVWDGIKLEAGRSIGSGEKNGLVISSSLARVFEKDPTEMIGSDLRLMLPSKKGVGSEKTEMTFRVIGFVEKKEIMVFVNIADVKGVLPETGYSRLKAKCYSSGILPEVREKISRDGFVVSALTDIIHQVDKAFRVIRLILGFFGAIALMVSAIGMFNTMTVALLERTEEIGIMKSIGASEYDILGMFVFESTIMGFLGGISGLIIGILGGKIFNLLVNFFAERFGGYATTLFYFPGWFLLVIVGIATFVGFSTGVIPARKAGATDPLEALRYK